MRKSGDGSALSGENDFLKPAQRTGKRALIVLTSAGLITSSSINVWLATTASIAALAIYHPTTAHAADCVTGVASTFTNAVNSVTSQTANAVTGVNATTGQFVNGVTSGSAITAQGALTTNSSPGLNPNTSLTTSFANAVTDVGTLATTSATGVTGQNFTTVQAVTDDVIDTASVVTGFMPTTVDAVTSVGSTSVDVLETALLSPDTATVVSSISQTPFGTTSAISATGTTETTVITGTGTSSVEAAAPFAWFLRNVGNVNNQGGTTVIGAIDPTAPFNANQATSVGNSDTVDVTTITDAGTATVTTFTGVTTSQVYNSGGQVTVTGSESVLTDQTVLTTTETTVNSVDNNLNTTASVISALNETTTQAYLPVGVGLASVLTATNPTETQFLTSAQISGTTTAPVVSQVSLNPQTTDFLTSATLGAATEGSFVNGTTTANALTGVTTVSDAFVNQVGTTTTPVVNSVTADFSGASSVGNSLGCGPDATAAAGGTAVGPQAIAGTNASAFGLGAQATGNGSVAIGQQAVASATNATAIGNGAQALHQGSTAIGAGAVTTAPDQIAIGTAANTYIAPGITSDASRAAQTGPLQVVTSDKDGHLATDGGAIFGAIGNLQNEVRSINKRLKEADAGVAMALAMSGGFLPDDKAFAIAANYGFFNGENAVATNMLVRLSPNVVANGGLGVGVSDGANGKVGGRFGLQWSY